MYLQSRALYRVEYQCIPALVKAYEDGRGDIRLLNQMSVLRQMAKENSPSVNEYFDWDNLRITTYGEQGDDMQMVFYDFPEPIDVPQAVYGAVIIRGDKVQYFTFELSFDGSYVLGSQFLDMHLNYGSYPPMSADEFIDLLRKLLIAQHDDSSPIPNRQ